MQTLTQLRTIAILAALRRQERGIPYSDGNSRVSRHAVRLLFANRCPA